MKIKKVLFTVLIVLIVLISSIVFTSCNKATIKGHEELKITLEEKGYTVEVFKGDDIITEYGFNTVDKNNKDFVPTNLLDLIPMHLNSVDILTVLTANKGDDNVIVFYFNAASSAKNSHNKLVKEMEDFNKKMETDQTEDKKLTILNHNFEGKLFYFATENAENDIKE